MGSGTFLFVRCRALLFMCSGTLLLVRCGTLLLVRCGALLIIRSRTLLLVCGGTLLLMRSSTLLDINSVARPLSGDRPLLLIGVAALLLVAGAALLLVRGDCVILCVALLLLPPCRPWTQWHSGEEMRKVLNTFLRQVDHSTSQLYNLNSLSWCCMVTKIFCNFTSHNILLTSLLLSSAPVQASRKSASLAYIATSANLNSNCLCCMVANIFCNFSSPNFFEASLMSSLLRTVM